LPGCFVGSAVGTTGFGDATGVCGSFAFSSVASSMGSFSGSFSGTGSGSVAGFDVDATGGGIKAQPGAFLLSSGTAASTVESEEAESE
jgi:hypothetical protein